MTTTPVLDQARTLVAVEYGGDHYTIAVTDGKPGAMRRKIFRLGVAYWRAVETGTPRWWAVVCKARSVGILTKP
jgi:hypothetical protein